MLVVVIVANCAIVVVLVAVVVAVVSHGTSADGMLVVKVLTYQLKAKSLESIM